MSLHGPGSCFSWNRHFSGVYLQLTSMNLLLSLSKSLYLVSDTKGMDGPISTRPFSAFSASSGFLQESLMALFIVSLCRLHRTIFLVLEILKFLYFACIFCMSSWFFFLKHFPMEVLILCHTSGAVGI